MPKALVTGASSGIGYAIAQHLLQNNWEVLGWSRRATGPQGMQTKQVDLRDSASYKAALEDLWQRDFSPDLLVHAAGQATMNHLVLEPDDRMEESWQLNLRSALWLVRDLSRRMRVRDHQGPSTGLGTHSSGKLMVLFSTIAVPMHWPGETLYTVCKAGLEQLVKQAAIELEPWHIRINALGPGPVDTPLWRSVPLPAQRAFLNSITPSTLTSMDEILAWLDRQIQGQETGQIQYTRGYSRPSPSPGASV